MEEMGNLIALDFEKVCYNVLLLYEALTCTFLDRVTRFVFKNEDESHNVLPLATVKIPRRYYDVTIDDCVGG